MLPRQIGRYQVRHRLGRGGMGTVYLGYDVRFRRYVAIKLLPIEFLDDSQFLIRFRHEARLIASLEHTAIVPVYDFGEHEGQPYLVMRYMAGGTLREQLQRGPLPLAEACRIMEKLAAALDKAHSRGIIHRDIKTANVLFDEDGEPYLSDFGSARLMAHTHTSTLVGTPNYMAPEQWSGEGVDARTDVYQMGAMLFEILTGQLPFEADTPPALMFKHINSPVPLASSANPNLPGACDEVIQRAMSKRKEGRYPSAGAMAAALKSAPRGGPAGQRGRIWSSATVPIKNGIAALKKFFRSLPRAFWIGLIGGLIVLALAAGGAWQLFSDSLKERAAPTVTPTLVAPSATATTDEPTATPSPSSTSTVPKTTPSSTVTPRPTTPPPISEPTLPSTPTRFPTYTPSPTWVPVPTSTPSVEPTL